ncbi:MAG: phosphatidylserine decarboxylase family protein [Calditrichaeota bacterium]|nr:MAG: phosphatidylserine decarboxylase family protein [Calditrichota bacterium]
MSREGIGPVVGLVLFTGIVLAGAIVTARVHLQILSGISLLLTLLVVNFFRDPERTIPEGEDYILSPADGKVVEIRREFEDTYLKGETTRVSIFLSIFDVHINRVPMSGRVEYFRYRKGSFVQAYKSEASEVNEQTAIGIENGSRKILFKQIAGILARRIVCNIREGNTVRSGERFGMIKFGSRVDIFVPENVELRVALNQKVKGGESIIGVFK